MAFSNSVEVSYRLNNTNSQNAQFVFATKAGNGFVVDGHKAYMTCSTAYQSGHTPDYTLAATENVGFLVDFFAWANKHTVMQGIEYEAVDIAKVYSNQELAVEIQFSCTVGGTTETCTATFHLNPQ